MSELSEVLSFHKIVEIGGKYGLPSLLASTSNTNLQETPYLDNVGVGSEIVHVPENVNVESRAKLRVSIFKTIAYELVSRNHSD